MSENDEKKARLEAIRAANRAKAAAEGGAATEAPAVAAPVVAETQAATTNTSDEKAARLAAIRAANAAKTGDVPAAPAAAPAATTNTSDEKAARLAAIRAANAAKGGDAPAVTATTTNLSAPAAAAAAPRAAAPAAAAAAKPALPPRKQIPRLYKVIGGAVFMTIVFVLLATTTKQYLLATIFGVVLGGAFGLMFGSWPPGPGDEVTGGD